MAYDALFVRLRGHKDLEALKDTPPLACLYLSEALQSEGYSCKVIDGLYGWIDADELERNVLAETFRWLCLCVTCAVYLGDTIEFGIRIKRHKPETGIILGGHFHSVDLHRRIMRDFEVIDAIVLGEAESALPKLIRHLEGDANVIPAGSTVRRPSGELESYQAAPAYESLDEIPPPTTGAIVDAIKTRDAEKMAIVGSRGCYGRCTFCSCAAQARVSGFSSGWRGRSPESIVDEMSRYQRDFGSTYFDFVDANFFGPGAELGRERARRLADLIRENDIHCRFRLSCRPNDIDHGTFAALRKAGLDHVFLGLESGSADFLDAVNKGVNVERGLEAIRVLASLGIFTQVGFVMFFPWSTLDEIRENVALLKGLGPDILISDPSNTLYVLPGTQVESSVRTRDEFGKDKYYMDETFWKTWRYKDLRARYYSALVRDVLGSWLNALYYAKYYSQTSGAIRPAHPNWKACKALETAILDCMMDVVTVVCATDMQSLSLESHSRVSGELTRKFDLLLAPRWREYCGGNGRLPEAELFEGDATTS